MNKQLAEKVKALILKNHEHFAMEEWTGGFYGEDVVDLDAMRSGCGTTGCIAAWTCIAAGVKIYDGAWIIKEHAQNAAYHVEGTAASLLGFSSEAFSPFRVLYWPGYLQEEYDEARQDGDTLLQAQIACEALDWHGQDDDES